MFCYFLCMHSTELEVCNKTAKVIKDELQRTLNKLADDRKKSLLVYFMGYTKTVHCCYCYYLGSHPGRHPGGGTPM